MEGVYVRSIGAGIIDAPVYGIAASPKLIAVSTSSESKQILLFDAATGGLVRSFGPKGCAEGQLSNSVAVRFTPDGDHIAVVENLTSRLSLFTLTGEFVRCVGVGSLRCPYDVDFAPGGDMIVANLGMDSVCALTVGGATLARAIATACQYPTALLCAGDQLLVVDRDTPRVHVFASN